MRFYVNDRTGVVHHEACGTLRRLKDVSEWDPARAHLTPGVTAHADCLAEGLPGDGDATPTP